MTASNDQNTEKVTLIGSTNAGADDAIAERDQQVSTNTEDTSSSS